MNTDPLIEELLEALTMPIEELEELARGSWCRTGQEGDGDGVVGT